MRSVNISHIKSNQHYKKKKTFILVTTWLEKVYKILLLIKKPGPFYSGLSSSNKFNFSDFCYFKKRTPQQSKKKM